MAKIDNITIKKITEKNISDAYNFVDDYNSTQNTCPYTKEDFDNAIIDPTSLLYGTYLDGKLVAISGITIDMSCCLDFLEHNNIEHDNNVRFATFAILPSARGEQILSYSTEKLVKYVKDMDCDNLLCVCGLDDIVACGIAKKLGMEMQENYDSNNRKVFLTHFDKTKSKKK